MLGGVGPGQRAGRARQGLHRQDRHRDEVRIRAMDQLCRSLSQRAEHPQQALRSDHRRQPVDRRRGRERPLCEAQRFLQERRNLDGRFHAGDRRRLFRMAEEHAELLGAARHGGRGRLDLSQGLVLTAGDPGRVQEEIQPRSRASEDL